MQKKLNCRFSNPEINFQNGKRNKTPERDFNGLKIFNIDK